jgi:hypothetical protein
MRDFLVYLAVPITGLILDESTSWRRRVIESMPEGIRCISPPRNQNYRDRGPIQDAYGEEDLFASGNAVMCRDYFDCTRADMVICNLLGAKRVSIGSVMELTWCYIPKQPVVNVMGKENIHRHAMLVRGAARIVSTVDDAIRIAYHVLLPEGYPHGKALMTIRRPDAGRKRYKESPNNDLH